MDAKPKDQDTGAQSGVPAAQSSAPAPTRDHTRVKGRFNQYTSGYWVLALPLLGVRYIAEGINEIFEPQRIRSRYERVMNYFTEETSEKYRLRFAKLKETLEKQNKDEKGIWKEVFKKGEWWPLPVAGVMLAATTYYSARTYGDMKRQYKDAVGLEFNKDPEKVNYFDLMKSKNMLVRDVMKTYNERTAVRYLVQTPFTAFLFHTPFKSEAFKEVAEGHVADIGTVQRKHADVKLYKKLVSPKGAVNLAMGTTSVYLASDALFRKRTFFEEMQTFIDNKINHNDRVGDPVTAEDIMNLYDRAVRFNPSVRPLPKMNTTEWTNDKKLFERIADLMNQTYGNKPNTEGADFTAPKLIYMLGMHLLKTEDHQKNMAYVEVANRYGIKEVEKMAAIAKNHDDLKAALAPYPDIARKVFGQEPVPDGVAEATIAAPQKTFANEGLKKPRPNTPPASQVDRITQGSELATGMGQGLLL